jgi:hypothetical protein
MQADGRLVEHVERVGQVRAERVRQRDALRLAAGQRARLPVQREVAEPDVVEELDAGESSRTMGAATPSSCGVSGSATSPPDSS